MKVEPLSHLEIVYIHCRVCFMYIHSIHQGPVVQIAIQWISVDKTNHAIHWTGIYPVDSVVQSLNNWGL